MKRIFKNVTGFVKKHLTIFIILFIFLFLFICDNTSLKAGNLIINNLKSIATSFTPTTDLFDDGSEISFVSYFFGMKVEKKEEKVDFYYPTQMQNISSSEEYFVYSFDGILKSVAKGEVCSVGYTKDNEKYVEIEHSNGYISRYVGLETVGVSVGEKVKAKNAIGMISSKEKVKVYIHKNGNIVKISDIKWKK